MFTDSMNNITGEKRNYFSIAAVLVIIILACIPLFVTFPYRVNIFLSWEGAYRISKGELPFRDFGTPLGGMYWVIPGIFFKIFGPQMFTLVKAQVFINIISGLSFLSILKSCKVRPGIIFVSVLLYCLSFSFFNFWPWYNHTVIVYEFVGLAFLFRSFSAVNNKRSFVWLLFAAFFTCCSFLTKQDAGGMALMISLGLLFYWCMINKKWMSLFIYATSFAVILFLFVAPFLKYNIGYWFNHGQAPHSSRISIGEILVEFFTNSQWIKFYLFLIIMLLVFQFKHIKHFLQQKNDMLLLLLTLAIIGEAIVFQVTSYTPPDNNIFFHSFAIAFILTALANAFNVDFGKTKVVLVCIFGVMIWWSSVYWKYIQRVVDRVFPQSEATISSTGENIVNRKTYILNTTPESDPDSKWVFCGLKSFDKIYMPEATAQGIKRLMDMDLVKQHKQLSVLNMSELTPLATEIPFELEKGPHYPLWYHLGVAMFNKQAAMFEHNIVDKKYDLILFEYVPGLNNFYPFRVRDSLMNHYQKVDSFLAPRRGESRGMIEIYTR